MDEFSIISQAILDYDAGRNVSLLMIASLVPLGVFILPTTVLCYWLVSFTSFKITVLCHWLVSSNSFKIIVLYNFTYWG